MKVNFDNLRIRGVEAYNRLVAELNRHVDGEVILGNGVPQGDTFTTGYIRDELDALRDMFATLISIYDTDGSYKGLDIELLVFAPEKD